MNNKASTIISLAQEHLGDPYVYGAWGSPCTPELRRKYARLNPSHAGNITKKCQVLNGGGTSCTGCKWQGALAYDCRGFTHWLLKQVGIEIAGGGATSQYNTISNWAVRGKIADMPDVVCCLFRQSGNKMEHTGMHISGGQVIHCSAGVQTGNIGQGWTHYAVPVGLYSADEIQKAGRIKVRKTLRKGTSGDEVRASDDACSVGLRCRRGGWCVRQRDGGRGACVPDGEGADGRRYLRHSNVGSAGYGTEAAGWRYAYERAGCVAGEAGSAAG